MPELRPEISIEPLPDCLIVPVNPPGEDVAMYRVIGAPPFEAGASNSIFAVVMPVRVAVTEVGACGAVIPQVLGIRSEIPAELRSKVLHKVKVVRSTP